MLRFLNIFKTDGSKATQETMRARFERVTAELDEVLADLDSLPRIDIDPEARSISITPPEQFADEALALPSPTEAERAANGDADSSENDTLGAEPNEDTQPATDEKTAA